MTLAYNKSQMLYSDYLWSSYSSDDPRVSGKLNDLVFSRMEGEEVIYLITTLMQEWGLEGKTSGQKLERMIRLFLPYNITSQINVKTWLKQNWKFY
jgi:hypothetical protein